ncbi:hypothetical protein JCM17380_45310 [Desulfosporosinus burensis]
MARKYDEFISVDADFIPVFSEHSDALFPNKWKSFYPHDSFKSIIAQLIDTLEKGIVNKDLPIWMHGAYGTGKTFASFVIKHLLEDRLNDVETYFSSNNMQALFARIAGVRNRGNILVVHRSSSSSVVGDNKLFNCIIESIKGALAKGGYTYRGGKSQYDNILSSLKDPSATFNFANAFERHKRKFEGYQDVESVVRDLEDLGIVDSVDLLETIVEVAELENYNWSSSYNDVINWIEDVVKGNKLYAIVFIWDEFTEFFKNNQNNITGLQEIAHAAARINFYFFLITHSATQIINDQNAKKIIEARFKIRPIDMAETTAFKLMGQAIKRDLDLSIEWDKVSNDLWGRVERVTRNTIIYHSRDANEAELKSLLPMHPYAAYLLKIISKEISSNQRTMFQFLSGDYQDGDKEKCNFRWFLKNHNSEIGEWNYLTSDYIWDYFFTDDNVDLNVSFKSAIAQYDNFVSLCGGNEYKQKVLKVALLLSAIQQKSGTGRAQGQSVLLRATMNNISTAFVGTPVETLVASTMAEFVSKGLFSTIQEGNDTLYIPPVGNIDQERFDKIKEDVKKQITFEKILSDATYNVTELFKPDGFLNYRFQTFVITPNNYKAALDEAKKIGPYLTPSFYIFALNDVEQSKFKTIIAKILNDAGRNVVLVDFSSTPFNDVAYEKFLVSKTEERYYGEDSSQGKLAKQNSANEISDWKKKLNVTRLDIYPQTNGQPNQVQGGSNLRKKLKEFNALWFGCGLEEISTNDKIFAPSGFKETVAQMAMNRLAIPPNYSYLNQISTKLTNENIWNNPDFVSSLPNHTVSKMKKCITDTIKMSLRKNSMVAIKDIWNALQQPPFGLLSCTGAVFLLGFLLKEYADGTYYKFDGANTVALNHTDLSDLIFSVVKGQPKANGQFIVKQKPEHIEFCRITGNVFKIAKDKQNSIQDIVKNINIFLRNNEYPLWTLEHYISNDLDEEEITGELLHAIRLYCELISPKRMAGRDITHVAEDLYALYKQNAGIDTKLETLVRVENLKTGMEYYIAVYRPELIQVIKRLGIPSHDLLTALNKKLSADSSYLWDVSDTNQQIDNLLEDYVLIDTINLVLSEKQVSLDNAYKAVEKKLNLIKLPDALLLEARPELKEILNSLKSIRNKSVTNKADVIKRILLQTDALNAFFANQLDVFYDSLKNHIVDISTDEKDYLYNQVDEKAFFKSAEEFIMSMNNNLKVFRKNKKINRLYELWESKAGCTSPTAWSKQNRIPILCLFEGSFQTASKIFELLNRTRNAQSEVELDDAIAFISGDALEVINYSNQHNQIFRAYFCGEYAYIIDDINELKDAFIFAIGEDIYSWVNKRKATEECVKKLAERKYKSVYKQKVIEKISNLSANEAQKFLVELIEDKPLVGINILKGRGGEQYANFR